MCPPQWYGGNSTDGQQTVSTPSKSSGDVQADADAARLRLRLGKRGFGANLLTSGFGDLLNPDIKGVTLGT